MFSCASATMSAGRWKPGRKLWGLACLLTSVDCCLCLVWNIQSVELLRVLCDSEVCCCCWQVLNDCSVTRPSDCAAFDSTDKHRSLQLRFHSSTRYDGVTFNCCRKCHGDVHVVWAPSQFSLPTSVEWWREDYQNCSVLYGVPQLYTS